MTNIEKIRKFLKGKKGDERKTAIKEVVNYMSDNEKEAYREFYHKATPMLRTSNDVAHVGGKLIGEHAFFEPESYFPLIYALSCAAAGEPIQTPNDVVREAKKKRKIRTNPRDLNKGRIGTALENTLEKEKRDNLRNARWWE